MAVDASSKDLGAVILQEDKPIAFASRALTLTQQRYAQIDKETLAMVYVSPTGKSSGKLVEVQSVHKPLEHIYLHTSPSLHQYDLKVEYKPGVEMHASDAHSRAYLREMKETLIPDLEVNEVSLTVNLLLSPDKFAEFKNATAEDTVMQVLQAQCWMDGQEPK